MNEHKLKIILFILIIISGFGIIYKNYFDIKLLEPSPNGDEPDYFRIFYDFFKKAGCKNPEKAAEAANQCRTRIGEQCISIARDFAEKKLACVQACNNYNPKGLDCNQICNEIVESSYQPFISGCMREYILCLEEATNKHCKP